MHSSIGNEPQEMQPRTTNPSKHFLDHLVPPDRSFRDSLIDPGQVLINNAARSQVHVADLGISHLSGRQPDIETTRAHARARVFAVELIMKWRSRQQGGVSIRLCRGPSPRINPPAVSN